MQKHLVLARFKRLVVLLLALLAMIIILIAVSVPLSKYIKPDDLMMVENQPAITIDNINVISMDANTSERISKNRQIVISNGLISAINPAGTPASKASRLIDAKGAYVIPGLFDMHVHLYERKYLVLNLAYGITSVRAMNGQPMHLRWKEELKNKEWLGSNLIVSSSILDGINTNVFSKAIANPEQGREQVRKAQSNGYDFIKVYGYLGSAEFEAIVDEANRLKMAVAKHGPHPVKGSEWKWLKDMQSLEHVEDVFQGPLNYKFDYKKLKVVAKKLKNLNVPIVATLETFDHLTQLSESKQQFVDSLDLDYLNPLYLDILQHFTVERWLTTNQKQVQYLLKENQFLAQVTKVLHDEGVNLLVGSDAGTNHTIPGVATHNEMKLLKQAGLTDYEILKAATINAAETLDIDEKYGSIKVGKIADLVLTQNNPVKDITELKKNFAVVKNGQWLAQDKLKAMKLSAKNNRSYYWSFIDLLEGLVDRQLF
jgi:imidazolonepropionase-like amidohydrolase